MGKMTHVPSLKFHGREDKLLEILYNHNVMQKRSVGRDQRAYLLPYKTAHRTPEYRTSSFHNAARTFTWNSKVTPYSQKPGSQRCWFLCPKCCKTYLRHFSIFNSKTFSRNYTPGPQLKGKRGEWRGENVKGAERMRREGLRHGCWGRSTPLVKCTEFKNDNVTVTSGNSPSCRLLLSYDKTAFSTTF